MDNITHSLVGLAVGELAHRSLPPEPDAESHGTRRKLLLFSCWAASNFPDLDLFFKPLLPAPLGYLLHHRGHTHTLLYAIPQAMLLWAMIWLLWPAARKLLKASASARIALAFTLAVGLALHITMDYLNSYGVHPFYPFDSRWLYGDMVFIVEPVFWVALGVPMAMTVRRWPLKSFFLALLAAALLFFTAKGFLSWVSLAVLLVAGAVIGALQHRAGVTGRGALIAAFCLCIGFVGMQGYASGQARRVVTDALQSRDPSSRVLDAAMTSFPTNPVCWTFASVEKNESAGTYRLRGGTVSLMPEVFPVTACPDGLVELASQRETTPAIALSFAEEGNLNTLRKLKAEDCHFEAWLRFARAPMLTENAAFDARFSSAPRGNFTTFNLADFKNRTCREYIPSWGFPRQDLLTP